MFSVTAHIFPAMRLESKRHDTKTMPMHMNNFDTVLDSLIIFSPNKKMTPKQESHSIKNAFHKRNLKLIQMIVLVLFSDRMAQTNCRRVFFRALNKITSCPCKVKKISFRIVYLIFFLVRAICLPSPVILSRRWSFTLTDSMSYSPHTFDVTSPVIVGIIALASPSSNVPS